MTTRPHPAQQADDDDEHETGANEAPVGGDSKKPAKPSLEDRLNRRLTQMGELHEEISGALEQLHAVLPRDWIAKKTGSSEDLEDFGKLLEITQTALLLYAQRLQNDPDSLPDAAGGDYQELKRCFKDINMTIHTLGELITDEKDKVRKFANRVRPEATGGKETSVVTEPTYEELISSAKQKKKSRHKGDYVLPGVYREKINETIGNLVRYAAVVAPLVGVTLQHTHMTENARPEETIGERREFSMDHAAESPEDYGIPKGWVDALNLRFNLNEVMVDGHARVPL